MLLKQLINIQFLFYTINSIEQICYIPDTEEQSDTRVCETQPVQIFTASESCDIQSLEFFNDFLIVGCNGSIVGFIWNEKTQRIEKKSWEVKIPSTATTFDTTDVNCMYLDRNEGILYAGCGDNEIYSITLENGTVLRTYSGHKDYIHSVDGRLKI